IIPGFGWHDILGVREKSLEPGKQFSIHWGSVSFSGTGLLERFEVLGNKARPVAFAGNNTPIAFESHFGKGSWIIFGSFVGQANQQEPTKLHPLAEILAQWASLSPPHLKATPLLELREMSAPGGRLVFLFNHGTTTGRAQFQRMLEKQAKSITELITKQKVTPTSTEFNVDTQVPAQSVRIYRINY